MDVTIAIPSLSLGDGNGSSHGADFFDSAQFPTAQFKADIYKTDTGYEARGPLTIRDKIGGCRAAVHSDLQENTATMTGETGR